MVRDDLSGYRDDLAEIEARVARDIEIAWRGPAIAIAVTAAIAGLALPHTRTGALPSWALLPAPPGSVSAPVQIFIGFVIVFGVGCSALAVLTQRWAAACIAMAGTGLGTVLGVFAYWSQQAMPATAQTGGAGIGLLVDWVAMAALTVLWVPLVAGRSNVMSAHPHPGPGSRNR